DFSFMESIPELRPRLKLGVVGATGVVGAKLLKILKERNFPISELHIYASPEKEGHWIATPYHQLCIEKLDVRKPPILDLVFMAAGAEVARQWGWRFAHRGAIVIDKSSYFRNKLYAPLVVPEVNPEILFQNRGIIANPNCTTIPLVMALAPLHAEYGLKDMTIVSFQSVSGSGRKGMETLLAELENTDATPSAFPHRIAYNTIPWIGSRTDRISGEESKLISESRRILRLPRLPIRATAARVPVMIGHSLAVHASFRNSVSVKKVRQIFTESPGISLIDEPESDLYPTPLEATGKDEVLVGRIRRDRGSHGLALWISTDNLRKGAATNAVQIAEYMLNKKLIGETA
ncbi:MAG: aspartate-semialdehyde dehydrogenase, partial [Calditrichaeota bacterium]|nr:aspartate-semialdehyde dehydrogenase [Calditrichota bacterium]